MKIELHDILHISEKSTFCIIDGKIVFITNDAISDITKRKNISLNHPINTFTYEDRIVYCENNFLFEDLLIQKEGIIFFGEENDIQN